MLTRIVVLFGLCTLVLVAVTNNGWCGQKQIKGNIAGQVVTELDEGVGCVSVALVNIETCEAVQQQFLESRGNFFFRDVEAGIYIIKVYDPCCIEIPSNSPQVNLSAGHTRNLTVTVLPGED